MRSATASACIRSTRPFRNARSVNSPGSASRAPASIAALTICAQHHRIPMRADLDDLVSGVRGGSGKERDDGLIDRVRVGPDKAGRHDSLFRHVIRGVRLQRTFVKVAYLGSKAPRCVVRRCRSHAHRAPLRRTTPIPPRPGGVAIATMVSAVENIRSRQSTVDSQRTTRSTPRNLDVRTVQPRKHEDTKKNNGFLRDFVASWLPLF